MMQNGLKFFQKINHLQADIAIEVYKYINIAFRCLFIASIRTEQGETGYRKFSLDFRKMLAKRS